MSGTFALAVNDTSPTLRVTATDNAGGIIDLTGASATFEMEDFYSGVPKVTPTAAVIEDAANGVLRYDWDAADVDLAGLFSARFVVTYSDGRPETFPNRGSILVEIQG